MTKIKQALEERGWNTDGFTLNQLLLITAAITVRVVDLGLIQPWAWEAFIKANGGP